MIRAFLKPGRAKPFWYGHPWVFSEAIQRYEAQPAPGELVALCDERGQEIGRGFCNPGSQIRVRLLARPGEEVGPRFWRDRLGKSLALRAALLGFPSGETNAFRLVNSEGDGLSGLTVDRLGEVLVVQLTSLGLWMRREEIFDALADIFSPQAIVEATSSAQAQEGIQAVPGVKRGKLPAETVVIRENGVQYRVSPVGQKTGFYCDQRENRRRVAALCQGKRILDAFCFVGGFGLNALRAGAREATFVDSSGKALALVAQNLDLNQAQGRIIEADALRFVEQSEERFDVVVLDPPKFATRAKDKPSALSAYRRLNAAGLRRVEPGGVLVTCSCSGLVSEEEFLRALGEASFDARRSVDVLWTAGAGADHPLRLPAIEGRYLKCVAARVL
jgi:23S rRNA (cytosine1962-C5)-methyltransferase